MTTEKQTPEGLAADIKRLAGWTKARAPELHAAIDRLATLASAQAQQEALRIAATSCPHEIDHGRVVLHFDPKQPGHNALNQLGRRLASAQAQQALTDLECPPDPEWVARQMQSEHAGLVPNGSGLVPKGWKLVPAEPTEAMLDAGNDPTKGGYNWSQLTAAGYKHGAWGEKRKPLTTLAARIDELAGQHGSLRAAARVLETDVGYLSRLRSGEKDDPSDLLLRRMGLRREVTYTRAHGITPADAKEGGQ